MKDLRGESAEPLPDSRLAPELPANPPAPEPLTPIPVVLMSGTTWNIKRLRRYFTQKDGFILVEGHAPVEQLLAQCQRMAPCILIAGEDILCTVNPPEFASLVDFGRSVKVLAYGSVQDDHTVQVLLRMGCMGFIEEGAPAPLLRRAVRAVASGEIWVGRKLLTRVLQQLLFATRSPKLTPREKEILQLIAKGFKNRAIGEKLCISHETVRWHIRSLHAKLGFQDRSGTALFARQYLEGDPQEELGEGLGL